MKILVITPKYYPDNFSVIFLVNAFKAKGHEVDVLTSTPFDAEGHYLPHYIDRELEVVDGVSIYRIKAYPRKKSTYSLIRNYLSLARKLNQYVKHLDKEYDVVYTFNVSPVTILKAGNTYCKKHSAIHAVHILDLWPISVKASGYLNERQLSYLYLKRVSKRLYQQADKLIIGSPSFASYLKDTLHINKELKYIPQPALKELREDHNILNNHEVINILYAGNFSTLQMVHLLIPALERSNVNNINLYFVGSGKDKELLLAQKASSNIKEKIFFINRLSYKELSSYYHSCDLVFVGLDNSTPVGKTIPNKLITAFGYAKAVMGMIEGDGKDLINETNGGFIIPQDNEQLRSFFISLSKINKKDLVEMGLRNKAYYNEHFDVEVVSEKLLSSFSRK